MSHDPKDRNSLRRTGWFHRYGPLIAAGFVTGILFGLIQSPDKSAADWILIAVGAIAAALLWWTGLRRSTRGG